MANECLAAIVFYAMIASEFSIRPYTADMFDDLIKIFRANVPDYFHMMEEKPYVAYLDAYGDYYSTLWLGQVCIGGGGINIHEDGREGRLSWGMIHPDHFHSGYGTILARHRMDQLLNQHQVAYVRVRTSQHTSEFYRKLGFEEMNRVKDFWAPGMDLVDMVTRTDRK